MSMLVFDFMAFFLFIIRNGQSYLVNGWAWINTWCPPCQVCQVDKSSRRYSEIGFNQYKIFCQEFSAPESLQLQGLPVVQDLPFSSGGFHTRRESHWFEER